MSTARHDDRHDRSRSPRPGARALVVAPDPARAHALALRMRYQGYRPSVVRDASGAVAEARLGVPELVVIDPPSTEPSGHDTAVAVSAVAPGAAMFVLAGDPRDPGRLRAVRVTPAPPPTRIAPARPIPAVGEHQVRVGDLAIDRRADDAELCGVPARLTGLEFRLLWTLASVAGTTLDRDAIHDAVWGGPLPAGSRVVDVLVRRLRRKVDECGGAFTYIQTVPGKGYLLEATPRAITA
jgi:DNA-binding response OmpR family regulator